MPEPFEFHQIHVGVRPTRAIVRMGSYEGWEQSALRVLEVLSITWGGAGDAIITCNEDGVTHEHLWAAAELYDPDVWASHVRTCRGYQLEDPDGYEQFVDTLTDKQLPDSVDRDTWRSQLHSQLLSEPRNNWTPPSSFWQRARKYVAPSWDRQYGHPEHVRDGELPAGLLVDLTHLSPLPDRVLVPNTAGIPLAARVLIASKWGSLAPAARERLEERGVAVQDVPVVEADLPRILAAVWGEHSWLTAELLDTIAHDVGLDEQQDQPGAFDVRDFDQHGPFAASMTGLGEFSRTLPMRHDWPLVVVVGDTADDFAHAMILDRCMSPALWVPPHVLGQRTLQAVIRALVTMRHRDDRHRQIHLTSCSLDRDELEHVAAELRAGLDSEENRIRVSTPVPLPAVRPLGLLDARLANTREDELFVGNTTGRGFRARLPTGVHTDGQHQLSWWNDVARPDHQLPTRWALNEHIVARSGGWQSRARVTREGIAFHSHPLGLIPAGLRLDQIVDNPRLRFLDAKATFEVLAAEADLTLDESPAGRFTARATELWGGLPTLIEDLQRPLVRRVLDGFRSTTDSGIDPGNYIADRRYLSLKDLEQVAAGGLDELTGIVDRFLHTGVLRRGLSLRCDHCNHFGWYDANDTGQTFRCWRCRTDNLIDSMVVRGGGTEPSWYYALAEVVYQACKANFNVPVLALHKFAGNARSVLGITDHKVRFPDDDEVEIDLWGIVDGRIVLGEAKTGSKLEASAPKCKKKAGRLRRAADALTADILVLATAASSWAPGSIEAIKHAFNGARCKVTFLDSVDPHLVKD